MEDKNEKLTPENEAAVTPDTDTEDINTAAEAAAETVEETAKDAAETAEETVEVTAEEATEAVEETAEEATEATEEAVEEAAEEAQEAVEEAAETVDETVGEGAEPAKKSKLLQRTIIISAAIVICAVLVAIVCRLFFFNGIVNTNLLGGAKETCWHYSTPVSTGYTATTDEAQTADYYFIFEPDGTLKIEIGSFEYDGVYSTQYLTDETAPDKDSVGKPVVSIENTNSIDGMYFYEVSGNVFTGKTMKLTSTSSDKVVFDFDDKAYTSPKIEREGEFSKDEKVVGSWTNKNEYASQTLKFNADGSYSISTKTSTSKQVENGLYNCKDGSITLSSYYIATQSQSFKYTVTDDQLTIIQQMMSLGDDGKTPVTVEQPIVYTKD